MKNSTFPFPHIIWGIVFVFVLCSTSWAQESKSGLLEEKNIQAEVSAEYLNSYVLPTLAHPVFLMWEKIYGKDLPPRLQGSSSEQLRHLWEMLTKIHKDLDATENETLLATDAKEACLQIQDQIVYLAGIVGYPPVESLDIAIIFEATQFLHQVEQLLEQEIVIGGDGVSVAETLHKIISFLEQPLPENLRNKLLRAAYALTGKWFLFVVQDKNRELLLQKLRSIVVSQEKLKQYTDAEDKGFARGTTFFSGNVNSGFYLPSTDAEVRITKDKVSIIRGGIFIRNVHSSRFSLEMVISNSSGIAAIHFPFRGEMIKLIIHRVSDGGSPSVGKIGDKFPLSGWSVAHKIPIDTSDTLTFNLSVSKDSFEYSYHLQPEKAGGWNYPIESPLVRHTHKKNSAYFSDLPSGLKNLQDAILFEAEQSTLKSFRLQLLPSTRGSVPGDNK